jgi:hypothetical protein
MAKRADYEARLNALRVRLDQAANRSKDTDEKTLLAKAASDTAEAVNANIGDDRRAAIL